MADGSHIEWTDATWNPITGCSVVSPGCTNCYAMKLAGTRLAHHPSRAGLTRDTKAGPVWTGEVRFNEQWLDQPLRWSKPRLIFVCAHGDLFAEGVPDEWIDKVFAVMAMAPQHTFQVLTKRPARMRDYLLHETPIARLRQSMRACGRIEPSLLSWPLPNVWLGVSVEDQARADERIPMLLDTPAAVRWISAEPLLGPVDLTTIAIGNDYELDALQRPSWREVWDKHWSPEATGIPLEQAIADFVEDGGVYPPPVERPPSLDWVVVGGESGQDARPMHPQWARDLREQCAAAGVAFHFKQWGEFLHLNGERHTRLSPMAFRAGTGAMTMFRVGKRTAGRLLDGIEHNGYPRGAHG